jgi:metal-responsive CopG/Arc/MetJ family transcriptional regulator
MVTMELDPALLRKLDEYWRKSVHKSRTEAVHALLAEVLKLKAREQAAA